MEFGVRVGVRVSALTAPTMERGHVLPCPGQTAPPAILDRPVYKCFRRESGKGAVLARAGAPSVSQLQVRGDLGYLSRIWNRTRLGQGVRWGGD